MTASVDREDWTALAEVLDRATKQLTVKRLEPVKLSILEFISTASMLELQDMADVGQKFNDFLLNTVAPRWDNEAVATLSFSIGALVEKMQMNEYGPAFSSGLSEVLLYLDFYEGEEGGEQPAPDAQEAVDAVEAAEAVQAVDAVEEAEEIVIEEESFVEDVELTEEELALVVDQEDIEIAIDVEKIAIQPEIEIPREIAPPPASEPPPPPAASPASLLDSDEIGYVIDIEDETGHVIDAFEWYKEVLATDPSSQVFCLLAEELCLRRQWREAVDVCKRGLRFHPQHLRGRVLLGWALAETGEAEVARETLQGARKELEMNALLYRALAEMEDRDGNSAEAQKLMDLYKRLGGERAYEAVIPVFFDEAPLRDAPLPPTPSTRPSRMPLPVERKKTPPPVPASKESPVIKILTGMLDRLAAQPEAVEEKKTIFSDSDRRSMKEILRAALH